MDRGWAYYAFPTLPVTSGWLGPNAITLYTQADDSYACGVDSVTWRDLVMLQDCLDPLFDDELRGLHRLLSSCAPKIGWPTCGRDRNRRGY